MSHLYQTFAQMHALLKELVAIPSVTESSAEAEIAVEIHRRLSTLEYFEDHPGFLELHPVGGDSSNRSLVSALVKANSLSRTTVVVIAHFDVVDVDVYGSNANMAFQVDAWTDLLRSGKVALPEDARADLEAGNWEFGRGIMDMKAGLVLNMSLIEWASQLTSGGNLLFLAVPDEERHSDGMLAAARLLAQMAKEHDLDYPLCIDTEPSLVDGDSEVSSLVYSGTGGKLLVGTLCIGKETHVEAPFEGVSGVRMVSELVRCIDGNPDLMDVVQNESAAPPMCLWSRDLKSAYSVSVPYKAAAYFNLLFLERGPMELLGAVRAEAEKAMLEFAQATGTQMQQLEIRGDNVAAMVKVRMFDEVLAVAMKISPAQVTAAKSQLEQDVRDGVDMRDATLTYVNAVSSICTAMHPMVVLFLAPPFYPAASSVGHPLVRRVIAEVQECAVISGYTLTERRYFTGLSDLSYVGTGTMGRDGPLLAANMPLWNAGYEIPLESLQALEIPVLNLGPFGKDAHKWTERLELTYTFTVLPDLLKTAIRSAWRHPTIR